MFIELVGSLRCPNEHVDTYLVAAPAELIDRDIITGTLGCPVCRAEYPIVEGAARFARHSRRPAHASLQRSEYEAIRCAALLDMTGFNDTVVLTGEWCVLAPDLLDASDAHLLLVNPPAGIGARRGLSILEADGIPMARRSVRGAALDSAALDYTSPERAADIVRDGGRLVAPAGSPLPKAARMLASDDRHWVAEVEHPAVLQIGRRKG